MDKILVILLGAYLVWRLATRSSKPGQEVPPPETLPSLEPPPSIYLDQQRVFMVNRFASLINATAEALKMDPDIIRALIYVQSGGDDAARIMQPDSEYGYGLTQITCSRARRLAADPNLDVTEITDCLQLEEPVNSVYYGAAYLRAIHTGDWTNT